MINRLTSIIFFGLIATTTFSEIPSLLNPLSEFSPQEIPLRWNADSSIPSASFTVYGREVSENPPSQAWSPVSTITDVTTASGVFKGEDGKTYEFRLASQQGKDAMLSLAEFNSKYETQRVWPVSTMRGFSRSLKRSEEVPYQGLSSVAAEFKFVFEDLPKEIGENEMLGLRFTEHIPTYDWSGYNFLEMGYRGDIPGGMTLLIQSASDEIRLPILQFALGNDKNIPQHDQSTKADVSPDRWHTIVVDLNKHLGKPSERNSIKTLALIKPITKGDLTNLIHFSLDSVRLWETRSMTRTTIDATPPSAPTGLTCTRQGRQVVLSWSQAEDAESGIVGYSYSMMRDSRKPLPMKVLTQATQVTLPLAPSPSYRKFHVTIFAQNGAGVWSEKVYKLLPVYP